MKKSRFLVLIIFSLTIVSIIAGVGYAAWTDDVVTTVNVTTWDYNVRATTVSGTGTTPSANGTTITGSMFFFFSGGDVELLIEYENDSTVPIKIDSVTFNIAEGATWGLDRNASEVTMLAGETSIYGSSYCINENKSYTNWILNPTADTYNNTARNLGIDGSNDVFRVYVKTSINPSLIYSANYTLDINYSVYVP